MSRTTNLEMELTSPEEYSSKKMSKFIDDLAGTQVSSSLNKIDTAVGEKLNRNGDGSSVTVSFQPAANRENITTGDTLSVLSGKISRFFSDIGSHAFKSLLSKSDMDSSVQASLNKADSALQSYTETDPTVPNWAKSENPPTYTKSDVGLGNVDNTSDANKPISSATQTALNGITSLIPEQATSSNQLADKSFVNSSISTATSYFRGTFQSKQALDDYSGPKTINDYAFVVETDQHGNLLYKRYKCVEDSESETPGVLIWVFEYTLNNSSFTASQWASIQSGITAELISSYNSHIASTSNPHTVTKNQIGLDNVANERQYSASNPPASITSSLNSSTSSVACSGGLVTISGNQLVLNGSGVLYGTQSQREALTNVAAGQIFIQIGD